VNSVPEAVQIESEQIVEAVVPEQIAEPEAVIAETKKSVKPSFLSPEQIAQRASEAKRHEALMALQMEDLRKKQELVQRRLEEEAKKARALYLKGPEPAIPSGKFPGMVWFCPDWKLFVPAQSR
jgi:translation initiation factor IF-2